RASPTPNWRSSWGFPGRPCRSTSRTSTASWRPTTGPRPCSRLRGWGYPAVMRRLGAWLGALLLLATTTAPCWVELPPPSAALELARAELVGPDAGAPRQVSLPHSWPNRAGEVTYRLAFS